MFEVWGGTRLKQATDFGAKLDYKKEFWEELDDPQENGGIQTWDSNITRQKDFR